MHATSIHSYVHTSIATVHASDWPTIVRMHLGFTQHDGPMHV